MGTVCCTNRESPSDENLRDIQARYLLPSHESPRRIAKRSQAVQRKPETSTAEPGESGSCSAVPELDPESPEHEPQPATPNDNVLQQQERETRFKSSSHEVQVCETTPEEQRLPDELGHRDSLDKVVAPDTGGASEAAQPAVSSTSGTRIEERERQRTTELPAVPQRRKRTAKVNDGGRASSVPVVARWERSKSGWRCASDVNAKASSSPRKEAGTSELSESPASVAQVEAERELRKRLQEPVRQLRARQELLLEKERQSRERLAQRDAELERRRSTSRTKIEQLTIWLQEKEDLGRPKRGSSSGALRLRQA